MKKNIFNAIMVGYEDGNGGGGDDGCSSFSWKE